MSLLISDHPKKPQTKPNCEIETKMGEGEKERGRTQERKIKQ
jgi:hypothetical protein